MRVLIIKLSSMGDILNTLPALTDAMKAIPSICFDWVVEECFTQIPSWHKTVNYVIPVAIRRWRKAWFSASIKNERKIFRNMLQTLNYDIVIDAQGLVKSAALVTRIANGLKHGMDWRTAREPISSLFYNQCHYIAKKQHAVERIRELFAKSLNYKKPKTQGEHAIAQHFTNCSLGNHNHYLIFIHATTCDSKLWPEANWRELIGMLSVLGLCIKLPWWTLQEEARAKRLKEGFNYVEVLPRMEINSIAQQLAGAIAVVSVDTGLSHLTAALNRPNITLYGPTDSNLIGSYGKNQYVCRPQHSLRLSDLSAAEVFTKLKPLLMVALSKISYV